MAGGALAFVASFWESGPAPSDHVPGFTQIAGGNAGGGRGGGGLYGATGTNATGTLTCASDWTSGSDGENGILISLTAAGAVPAASGLLMAGII
jgi:hypothetical protein